MEQLVKLPEMLDRFAARGVRVVAVSNEETSLGQHEKLLEHFDTPPEFELLADLRRQATARYERTTAYLADERGIVRQVFPMEIYDRPDWTPFLREIDRLFPESAPSEARRRTHRR